MRSAARGAAGGKEAVSAKTSAGLGKLMSALHQNAASLVNTKAEHNGPDQVLAATEYSSSLRGGAVLLRREETGLGSEEPLSVPTLLQQVCDAYPDLVALRSRQRVTGEWTEMSYRQLAGEVQTTARAFIETGLHRHHAVVTISFTNCKHWVVGHLAAISAGGIAAGLSAELSGEEIARACIDCKADIVLVQTEAVLKKLLLVQHKLPQLRTIVQYTGTPPLSDQRRLHRSHGKHILSWAQVGSAVQAGQCSVVQLAEIGAALPDIKLDERLRRVAVNQCCCVVQTSGSSGPVRAVMLSHDNLTWAARMVQGCIRSPGFNSSDHFRLAAAAIFSSAAQTLYWVSSPPGPGEERLLCLGPLRHVSTLLVDLYYTLSVAGTLVLPGTDVMRGDTDRELWPLLAEVRPSLVYAGPALFERLYHRLVALYQERSGVERLLIDWGSSRVREGAAQAANSPEQQRRVVAGISQSIARATVCKKFKEVLGFSSSTLFFCRGGPLPARLTQFLAGFDIQVHCALGQTECCAVLASGVPGRHSRPATVGKAGPGLKLRLTEAGAELWGRNIAMGYLNRENDTREMLEGGWLRLADTIAQEEEGYITVEGGRQADRLAIPGAEPLYCPEVEARVRLELPCVADCVLVPGPGTLGAILTLDTIADTDNSLCLSQAAATWFRAARWEVSTVSDVIAKLESGLKHVIQAGIDRYNLSAGLRTHCIAEWEVKHLPFSIASGEMGATGKVNRAVVTHRYQAQIDRMFGLTPTARKPSRELTRVEEEREDQLSRTPSSRTPVQQKKEVKPEQEVVVAVEEKVKQTEYLQTQETVVKEVENKIENVEITEEKSEKVETDDSGEKHVTVVSLEQQEGAEAVEDSKEQENVKSVRFTSNVIEIGEQQRASRE